MSKKTDSHTSTILRVWPIILFLFYGWYFIVAAILAAGFKTFDMNYVGSIPFDWRNFDPTGSDFARCCWAAMVLSIACVVIAVYYVGKSTRMAWDYAISTYIVHWAITCIVSNAFPTSWIWWFACFFLIVFESNRASQVGDSNYLQCDFLALFWA